MKLTIKRVFVFILVLQSFRLISQNLNPAFQLGEKITYKISYSGIDIGEAILEVKDKIIEVDGKKAYKIVNIGRTIGIASKFFKVRDLYQTYLEIDKLHPLEFDRDVNEGGYTIKRKYKFYHEQNKMLDQNNKIYKIPYGVHDMVSSFYFSRTINFDKKKKGDIITVNTFVDDQVWPLKIRYNGKTILKVGGKRYRCIKFSPVIQTGRLFESEDDVIVWVSDDKNHIPIYAEAKIIIGKIKLRLDKYQGLKNELAIAN